MGSKVIIVFVYYKYLMILCEGWNCKCRVDKCCNMRVKWFMDDLGFDNLFWL
jgi:hypothetical protein